MEWASHFNPRMGPIRPVSLFSFAYGPARTAERARVVAAFTPAKDDHNPDQGGTQNTNRNANCISRGVPVPAGLTGVVVFTIWMIFPKLGVPKVAWESPYCG